MGCAAGYAVVYPAWRDVERQFIIEDCLEGGDNLVLLVNEDMLKILNQELGLVITADGSMVMAGPCSRHQLFWLRVF